MSSTKVAYIKYINGWKQYHNSKYTAKIIICDANDVSKSIIVFVYSLGKKNGEFFKPEISFCNKNQVEMQYKYNKDLFKTILETAYKGICGALPEL